MPEPVSLDEAVRSARDAGVAALVAFRQESSLAGVHEIVRTAAEIIQRMGMPKLAALADARDLPVRARVSAATAAFYMPQYRMLGVVAKSIDPAGIAATFDQDDWPSQVAKWHGSLKTARADIRRRAQAMQARGLSRRWAVVRDVRSLIAHELGHHFHNVWRAEIDALIAQEGIWRSRWHLLISRYAGEKPSEFVAEAFALYITGDPVEHDRIHPALLAFFKSKERLT